MKIDKVSSGKNQKEDNVESKKLLKRILIVIGVVIGGIIAINILSSLFKKTDGIIVYILGVAVFAGIAYALYEVLTEIIVGVAIIGGGIVARYMAETLRIPGLLATAIIGLIVGLFIAPIMTIVEVKKLRKK